MKCLRPVLRRLAKFRDALEFALEEAPFHVEGIVIERAAEVGWLDDEVMDDGAFLAWRMAQKATPTLHKLPGIG